MEAHTDDSLVLANDYILETWVFRVVTVESSYVFWDASNAVRMVPRIVPRSLSMFSS